MRPLLEVALFGVTTVRRRFSTNYRLSADWSRIPEKEIFHEIWYTVPSLRPRSSVQFCLADHPWPLGGVWSFRLFYWISKPVKQKMQINHSQIKDFTARLYWHSYDLNMMLRWITRKKTKKHELWYSILITESQVMNRHFDIYHSKLCKNIWLNIGNELLCERMLKTLV